MTEAFIGLGANLGDRAATLASALTEMAKAPELTVAAVSHAYESEPWGPPGQPPYLNAVARLEFTGTPEELLAHMQRVETLLGRVRAQRFGPRVVDLDLLLFGGEERGTPELTLPHPRMLERDFVMTPLLAIAPDVRLPSGEAPDAAEAVFGAVIADRGSLDGFGEA